MDRQPARQTIYPSDGRQRHMCLADGGSRLAAHISLACAAQVGRSFALVPTEAGVKVLDSDRDGASSQAVVQYIVVPPSPPPPLIHIS